MMALLAATAAIFAFALFARGLYLLRTTGLEQAMGDLVEAGAKARLRRRPRRSFSERLVDRFYSRAQLSKLSLLLRQAGLAGSVDARKFASNEAVALVGAVFIVLMSVAIGQPLVGAFIGALIVALPRLSLRARAQKRQRSIETELPDFLDVLGVTVKAGLPFRKALATVVEFHDGPIAEEIRYTLNEMSVGVTRREAFRGLRARNGSVGISMFVTALLQAEELGVPLVAALTDIAAEVRHEYANEVRQRAAKAGPKISLVVTLTILPGALILLVASIVISNADTLGVLLP